MLCMTHLDCGVGVVDEQVETALLFLLDALKHALHVTLLHVVALHWDAGAPAALHLRAKVTAGIQVPQRHSAVVTVPRCRCSRGTPLRPMMTASDCRCLLGTPPLKGQLRIWTTWRMIHFWYVLIIPLRAELAESQLL